MAPMLSRADELRVDYGDALVAIVGRLLRCSLSDVGEAMLATIDAARPVLARLYALRGVAFAGSDPASPSGGVSSSEPRGPRSRALLPRCRPLAEVACGLRAASG